MEPELCEVWPENWAAVEAWLVVASQWRATPLADGRVHWHGLDYTGVRAGLELAGIALAPDDWLRLRVMEQAAAAALNGTRG